MEMTGAPRKRGAPGPERRSAQGGMSVIILTRCDNQIVKTRKYRFS